MSTFSFDIGRRVSYAPIGTNVLANISVEVDQVARGLDGTLLGEGCVLHVYVFRDDLIARMDVEELSGAAD